MSRHPSRGLFCRRRTSVAAVFAAFASLLLPTAHAEAAVSSHFSLRMHETFTEGIPSYRWGKYDGQPSSTTYSVWDPSHVQAYSSMAMLRGYFDGGQYVTGGMMLNSIAQTYGKYVVRARFSRSTTVKHTMLLWPTSGWPPEVDFSEGPTSKGVMATAHWGSDNSQMHAFKQVDMTQWHTYGVEWTPTRLLFTVDGVGWATMGGSAVPHQAMKLAIQTEAISEPSSTTRVSMDLADVYVWSYS